MPPAIQQSYHSESWRYKRQLNRLLMRVDNSAGKGMSGMDKFGSVVDRLQRVVVVDGAILNSHQ